MIKVVVLADGKVVAESSAPSRYALPDILSQTCAPWDQNPDMVWQREEKSKDPSGELTEVRVIYRKQTETRAAA